jgi:hypothetical protein
MMFQNVIEVQIFYSAFLYGLKLLTVTIKNICTIINHFSSSGENHHKSHHYFYNQGHLSYVLIKNYKIDSLASFSDRSITDPYCCGGEFALPGRRHSSLHETNH